MSTVDKGNELEDRFYKYLLDQKNGHDRVFGVYPAELCQIHKKRKYFCKERRADVEFDVVVEVTRKGAKEPHLFVVFECKNHSGSIPEIEVVDFSDKLSRIFKHNAKGFMVVSSPLQYGAQKILESRKIGLAKYNDAGFEIQIERVAEDPFVRKGIFEYRNASKPLKFSAYYEEIFYSSIGGLFLALDGRGFERARKPAHSLSVPYVSERVMKKYTKKLLGEIDYKGGCVDLERICSVLRVKVNYFSERVRDDNGRDILGFANFLEREIQVNFHDNKYRERFTLGHEIGHFYLRHDRFLRSETLVEEDCSNGI